MKKFRAPDPRVEVHGRLLAAFYASPHHEKIAPILEAAGYATIYPDQWYPMQAWLDVMATIVRQHNSMTATFDFAAIGFALAEAVPFSPMVKSFEGAMRALPAVYQLVHRNGYAGEMIVEIQSNRIQLVKCTPYPDDMTFGLLSGLARRFGLAPDLLHISTTERRRIDDERDTVFEVRYMVEPMLQSAS